MDSWFMKKIKIGYVPISQDLSHPADRRRVVFWAKERGHHLTTDLTEKVEVILLSERADFNKISKLNRQGVPMILDLVDAYLAKTNPVEDLARGAAKVLSRQLSNSVQPFTSILKDACRNSAGVVCSTPEQSETISSYSKNIHVVLDSHEEFPMKSFQSPIVSKTKKILWEGLPATLAGFKEINSALLDYSNEFPFNLRCVTDPTYHRLLGKYLSNSTAEILKRNLSPIIRFQIVPWSIENLIGEVSASQFSLIPLRIKHPMQFLKPENRLLIMWRLGLPCLTSNTLAYRRVSEIADIQAVCDTQLDWLQNMRLLSSEQDYAAEMVRKGQKYLLNYHSSEILLNKWDSVFDSVL
jgi:hypothetical protein